MGQLMDTPTRNVSKPGSDPFTPACFFPPPRQTLFPEPSYLSGVLPAFRVHPCPFLGQLLLGHTPAPNCSPLLPQPHNAYYCGSQVDPRAMNKDRASWSARALNT